MANSRTLTVLIADVREAADIEGLTDRHPDATLIKWINRAWRRLRTKLAIAGMPGLTTPTTIAALPTTPPVSTEQYLEVSWPDGATGVYGVDVLLGGEWVPLKPMSFAQRRDFQQRGSNGDAPTHWIPLTLPSESTTTITGGKIALFPLCTGGVNYRIWYLPVWVDITTPSNVFYGHDELWFEWAIQTVVRRVAQKDDDAQATLAEAVQVQADVWMEIKRSIQLMNAAEPIRRVRRDRLARGRRGA
jgi:hypothetical protein